MDDEQTGAERPWTLDPARARSSSWLDADGVEGFLRRGYLRTAGLRAEDLLKPVIGIAQTWSEMNPCHGELRTVAEYVKQGVRAAGGTPLEFPTMSLGEPYLRPTSMHLRNLMAMETEELMRAQPIDGAVLLGGCNKTVPAQLMASASVDLPTVLLTAGPSLPGRFRGERLGACTDCRRLWLEERAGAISEDDLAEAEGRISRSAGVCTVMGTASTMATLAEVLGLAMLGTSSMCAVDAGRRQLAFDAGTSAVRAVRAALTPSVLLTREAFVDAARVLGAIGGSTNAVVHLLAVAGRTAVPFTLEDLAAAMDTPLLVDVRPSGRGLMEDYDAAGGIHALLGALGDTLRLRRPTVSGGVLADHVRSAVPGNSTIRTLSGPLRPTPGLKVVWGSLAPRGAVVKTSAASEDLLVHTGPALVFDGVDDMRSRIDDPDLDVSPETVLVLRGVGPVGGPGMPEAGFVPIPRKLAIDGVTDMVRITDGRMSGTAFGTIVLHVSPEGAVDGPLARIRTGDVVVLDVPGGRLDLADAAEVLGRPDPTEASVRRRGWEGLYADHVLGAEQGADLDFLLGTSTSQPHAPRHSPSTSPVGGVARRDPLAMHGASDLGSPSSRVLERLALDSTADGS